MTSVHWPGILCDICTRYSLSTLQKYTDEKHPHTFNFPHLPPLYLLLARMLQLCDEKQVSVSLFYLLQTLLANVSSLSSLLGVWRVARILARLGSVSSSPRRRATGTRTAWWSRGRCNAFSYDIEDLSKHTDIISQSSVLTQIGLLHKFIV